MIMLAIVTAAALALAPVDRGPAEEVEATLAGIAQAVEADELPPITGSKPGDAILMTVWWHQEARWRLWQPGHPGQCISGDGGRSLGPGQIQGLPPELACAPFVAAQRWLAMARASVQRCGDLTALASGRCHAGARLVHWRMVQADRLLQKVSAQAGAEEE